MEIKELKLVVKESTLAGAGKGLFTEEFIAKETCIIEYKGTISTWKNVNHDDGNNAYVFFVNNNHVVDACNHLHELGRYANDAKGLKQTKGLTNNARYVVDKKRIFIYAVILQPGQKYLSAMEKIIGIPLKLIKNRMQKQVWRLFNNCLVGNIV